MISRKGVQWLLEHLKAGPFEALGLDGKEGPIRLKYNKYLRKDKQTVTDQVTGKLIDFFVLWSSDHSAVTISSKLYEILVEYGSVEAILSLSVDNERKNTGRKGGIIRLLEIQLNRAIQWICCLLHLIEVVFRHIFEKIDGKANGPQSYTGKIGKIVSDKDQTWKTNNPPLFDFEQRQGFVEETK